jgi:8-oxo-dGTP diphosphatase
MKGDYGLRNKGGPLMIVVLEKPALIYIEDQRLLCVRTRGRDKFYVPGGVREGHETDVEALRREMEDTIVPYGQFEAQAHARPEGTRVRMRCYTAQFSGEPRPSSEIEEIGWLRYDEKTMTSVVDQMIFDDLRARGLL